MTLRVVAATAVLISAVVHLYLWIDGMRNVDVIGPAFLMNAIGGAVIAVLLIVWRHWIPAFLAVGFGLSTLGGFIISTQTELFGVTNTWQGWEVWTSAITEVVAIVAGSMLLLADNPLRTRQAARQQASAGTPHVR